MEIYLVALVILGGLALFDLVVGVSNDAVNFLNSSFGSKVASRRMILIIASLGILAGVTFSSGMMEVARKGIFHPKFFTMPELMVIFLAVMFADIILLDLFNTFGLPTSTTVSIVFDLLGAAVAVSFIKAMNETGGYAALTNYINTGKVLAIISGILISVIIAFISGAVIQFLSRLIFTFDYKSRLKRYGGIWGGMALSLITYFMLLKGARGASFISDAQAAWMESHTAIILLVSFAVYAVVLQLVMLVADVNILKPIVLTGTFALAMAFAANDLVNFIGVPLAGLSAFHVASAGASPLTMTMEGLQGAVKTGTGYLLISGAVMVVTLWLSRKARTVTETELSLGRQSEGVEQYGSTPLSRVLVRMFSSGFNAVRTVLPGGVREKIADRVSASNLDPADRGEGKAPSFDLLRAAVNLMVSSALISFGTSLKLPLSTTYVTFMVAMGTSLSDQAWGRESAVYRVTGVLTVIGGWFFTAFMAFTLALGFGFAIYYFRGYGVAVIFALAVYIVWRTHHIHRDRVKTKKDMDIFNLRKIKDAKDSIQTTFEHSGIFLHKVNEDFNRCMEGLFEEDRHLLKEIKRESTKVQDWANIIIANIFKVLRLLHKEEYRISQEYAQIIIVLQEIAESLRDSVLRSYMHVNNHHKGLLDVQKKELLEMRMCLTDLLHETAEALMDRRVVNIRDIEKKNKRLKALIKSFDRNQIKRIQDESSKTRLSILFYGVMGNAEKISDNTMRLLKIFSESLSRSYARIRK